MRVSRRTFVKQGSGLFGVSLLMPKLWLRSASGRVRGAAEDRKITVIIQLLGGNDGLNTLIPYTSPEYRNQRPTLAYKEADLKDDQGRSTIITNDYAFHPSMGGIKSLYDEGKVAVVQGVGYPNMNESHFESEEVWAYASLRSDQTRGWLGRYSELAFTGASSLSAVSVTSTMPITLNAARTVPTINPDTLSQLGLRSDPAHPSDRDNRLTALQELLGEGHSPGSHLDVIVQNGRASIEAMERFREVLSQENPASGYGTDRFSTSMKFAANLIKTIPEANLLYVWLGTFDLHARQKDEHAKNLGYFSQTVKAFYDDLSQNGLGKNLVMMQWSEFGRRLSENGSEGTDHGTAAPMFVIGDPVRGGLYGRAPSLAASDLDFGQMRFTTDFREVYATMLDRWLGMESSLVLGEKYEGLGLFG